MVGPDLEESAWQRAKMDAGGIYRSAVFNIAIAGICLLAGGIAAAFSLGRDAGEVIVIAIVIGLGTLVASVLIVLIFQVAAAPLRQRNELRRIWSQSDQLEESQILVALSDFARRGDDLLGECKSVGYTGRHEERLELWTREVVKFLSRYCGQEPAQELALASKGSATFVIRLERRLRVLNGIIAADKDPAGGSSAS